MGNIDKNQYTSNARWPKESVGDSSCVTSDSHDTKEQARAVCRMLERDGFGGDGEIFPIETWVETTSDYPSY